MSPARAIARGLRRVPPLRQGAAAAVREEREQSQNGDREQNRVDDRATGDRDDQQDYSQYEKHVYLRFGQRNASPSRARGRGDVSI